MHRYIESCDRRDVDKLKLPVVCSCGPVYVLARGEMFYFCPSNNYLVDQVLGFPFSRNSED